MAILLFLRGGDFLACGGILPTPRKTVMLDDKNCLEVSSLNVCVIDTVSNQHFESKQQTICEQQTIFSNRQMWDQHLF